MARFKAGASNALSGMLGPVVMVQRGGMCYVRKAPQFSNRSWSPRQKQNRDRFKKINAFYKIYKFSVVVPIWNKIPEAWSGQNLFLKANAPAFGLDGELADSSLLHFSDGKLPSPFRYDVEPLAGEPAKISVGWENDPMLSSQFNLDELMVMVAHADQFSGPYATGILRSMQQGVITLPDGIMDLKAFYLFFGSPDRQSYSPDRYCPLV